ncbi:3-oxoacid CoA-transferase subunit B [Chloroflexota bacterium]
MIDNTMRERLRNKERLDEQTMALRAAKEIQEGHYVNLGFGIPTLATNFIPGGKTVFFHSETGILHYGRIATEEEAAQMGWELINASGQPIIPLPGMSLFDVEESFDMIRAGKLDFTILGGLQVSEKGDLANWRAPGLLTSIGGSMDLAVGAKKVIICMTHVTHNNEFKIVKECNFPLTGKQCVDLIVTDIAVLEVIKEGLVLKEIAPGWSANEVQALTEPKLVTSIELKEIQLI